MNNIEEMGDLPVILFPHSFLPEPHLKKILSFFGALTIFQPWFMERPAFIGKTDDFKAVKIMNPPENLKPGEGFKRLLSEYRSWIINNQDKSYTAFLKANLGRDSGEDATWEIRGLLRRIKEKSLPPREDRILKWHLILHLARELEEQRFEADRMLRNLKKKDFLLKGVIDEANETGHLLKDLPQFESEPAMEEYHLGQIFEAWFGLFGGFVKGDVSLITINQQVMAYVVEMGKDLGYWDESRDKPMDKSIDKPIDKPIKKFRFRDFSSPEQFEEEDILRHFSNKTLIIMADPSNQEIQ